MTTELATIEENVPSTAPITLFGTEDPQAVVEKATLVAKALRAVLLDRQLVKAIGNRNFVLLEGWTLLGSMLGVFAVIEWTRPVEDGWEARAVVRTMSGATVGGTEAMCTRQEKTWKSRDDYAIRSMAQTRAMAKALRMPLGFIVQLAGYDPTPADEMPEPEQHPGQIPISALRERVLRAAAERDMVPEHVDAIADKVYGKLVGDLSVEELLGLGTDIHNGKYDLPFDHPAPADELAPPGGADVPEPDELQLVLQASGGELVEEPAASAPAAAPDALVARIERARRRAEKA